MIDTVTTTALAERRYFPNDRAASTEISVTHMSDDRLERVARALCKADGHDPDKQVPTGAIEVVRSGQHEVMVSTWHRYMKEARRFITALDAAKGGA
jgi:hypothetical protein